MSGGTTAKTAITYRVVFNSPPPQKKKSNLKISGVLETNQNLAGFQNKKLFLAAERGITQ